MFWKELEGSPRETFVANVKGEDPFHLRVKQLKKKKSSSLLYINEYSTTSRQPSIRADYSSYKDTSSVIIL